jgi:hypothetical protein
LYFCTLGGAARISAQIKKFKQEANNSGTNVLVTHSGDALTGTLFYTIFGAETDAAYMNAIGFDAFVPGNHEFDDGDKALADLSRRLNTPVVSYNCKFLPNLLCQDAVVMYLNLNVSHHFGFLFYWNSTTWKKLVFEHSYRWG